MKHEAKLILLMAKARYQVKASVGGGFEVMDQVIGEPVFSGLCSETLSDTARTP